MASRKTLIKLVLAAIKAGDRRPEVLVLAGKIQRCQKALVHGYQWQVRELLEK